MTRCPNWICSVLRLAADDRPVAGAGAVEGDRPVVLAGRRRRRRCTAAPAANVYCSGVTAWYGHARRVRRLLRVGPAVHRDGRLARPSG